MRCKWCEEETPDNSAYCEKCGRALEDVEAVSDSEGEDAENAEGAKDAEDAEGAEDVTVKASHAKLFEGEQALYDEAPSEIMEDGLQALSDDEQEYAVFTGPIPDDYLLVNPPSPPDQPKLSRGRIAIVATIAILFAAAVILLAWAIILRVLGL